MSPAGGPFRSGHPLPVARPGELTRGRLLDRLAASRDTKVIVLAGGAGYGKTTVFAQWAASEQVARDFAGVVALTLPPDPGLMDAVSFVSLLLSAVPAKYLDPTLESARAALQHGEPQLSIAALSDMLNRIPGSVLLMLDGVQGLSAPARQCLERLVHLLEAGHQVALTVYDASTLPFLALLAAKGEADVLGADDLAFTPEETAQVIGPCQIDLARLTAMDGWPMAVGLLRAPSALGSSFDLLATSLLDRLPAKMRLVLQRMSVWEEWGEAEARLVDVPGLSTWLSAALDVGLPIAVLAGGRARPHALLRHRLNAELSDDPVRAALCWRHAAQDAERRGDVMRAARCARNSGDLTWALALASAVTNDLTQRFEFQLVRTLLEEFEVELLPPALQELLAGAWFETGDRHRAEVKLRGLEAGRSLSVRGCLVLAENALLRSDMMQAAEDLEKAERVAHSHTDHLLVGRFRVRWLIRRHEYQEALPLIQTLVAQAEALGAPHELGACLALQGVVLFSVGQPAAGVNSLRREVAYCETQGLPVQALAPRLNLALCLAFNGDLDDALMQARRALLDAQMHFASNLPRIWISLILIHQLRREYAEARRVVKEALAFRHAVPFTPQEVTELWMHALSSSARVGDHALRAEAEAQLDACLRVVPHPPPPSWQFVHASVRFTQARLTLMKEPQVSSHELVEQLQGLVGPPMTFETHVRLYIAEAQRRAGLPLDANLQALGELLRRTPVPGVLMASEPDLPEVFALLRQEPWWPTRPATPGPGPSVRPVLRISTLHACRAELNGQAVHLPLLKGAELLIWLALNGPGRRVELIDALWDGSREPKHAEYFRVLVRRVRDALRVAGPPELNPLPYVGGQYQLSPEFDIQVDVLDVLHAGQSTDETHLRTVVNLYRGTFLPKLTSEWVSAYRVRVNDAALLNLQRLAEQYEDHAPRRAVECYERMLHLDPFSDAGYEGALRCFIQLGDQAGIAHTQRVRNRLLAQA